MSESAEKKIEELSLELASVKEKRHKLNSEAASWAKERNSVHEQVRKLRKEAASIREKRDALNRKVKELKNLREQAKARRRERHVQISELREKMRTLLGKKPSQNLRVVQEEIDSLEWKIQTTLLSVKQEEEIITPEIPLLEIEEKYDIFLKKLVEKLD